MDLDFKTVAAILFRRVFPAAAFFAIGTGILLAAGDPAQMLFGFACFLLAAILVAGPLARLLAEPTGSLFWPKRFYDKPQPMYGIPQSRRAKGQLEEALAEYEKIAAAHPDEVRPWLEMIDLAVHDLKDARRANAIFQTGIARLKKPADQDALAQVYAEVLTRLDVRPHRDAIAIPATPRSPDAPLR